MRMPSRTHRDITEIDWQVIRDIRKRNFQFYTSNLSHLNELNVEDNLPALYYPFMHKYGSELRQELINLRIFIPKLWHDIDHLLNRNEIVNMNNTVLLPVDQRYQEIDMSNVVQSVLDFLDSRQ